MIGREAEMGNKWGRVRAGWARGKTFAVAGEIIMHQRLRDQQGNRMRRSENCSPIDCWIVRSLFII
jgi:hypothetical protein